ncbi:hypothetical protein PAA8504_01999 [Palleronia abyssalis]|uniref:Uncharacterized protein n=1 Tax=Palleronia abyssalis TaxID=1501240 RepID=A0A2R8BVI4_9RHOB|nr:hypothetical protein PAA8504_01999 [Palleronia abyssalis]
MTAMIVNRIIAAAEAHRASRMRRRKRMDNGAKVR